MATDDELREMERHLRQQYQRAGKEVLETAEKYFKKFESLDKQKQKQVEEGKLTEEEYQTWRKNKILYGEHWDRLLSQITGELYKTNQAAAAYVEGKSVKIFAENFNLVEKEIPDTPVKGYTFELVNEETVRQLATTGELMLPPPNPPDKYKDNKWNAKQVHAEVLQGILQGDSMDKIAKRLQNTVDKNHTSAIRNARTMVTAAENSGRQAGFDKAEKDGIIFKKEWIATVGDGRTRESHLAINGELVDNGELFSNGCEFPGDWRADPSEVYNCRCTLGSKFVGFKKKKLEEAVKAQEERKQEPEKKEEQKQLTRKEAKKMLENEIGFNRAMPSLSKVDEKLLSEVTYQLKKLEDKFGVVRQSTGEIRSAKGRAGTIAFVSREVLVPTNQSLTLCPDYYSSYDTMIRVEQHEQDSFHSMPCLPEERAIYTVTHEFGHILQNVLIEKEYIDNGWNKNDPRAFINYKGRTEAELAKWYTDRAEAVKKACYKEIVDIAKDNNPDFKLGDQLSSYGKSNQAEFFAEVFANSQLGAPNELGNAMNIWLDQKGLIKK